MAQLHGEDLTSPLKQERLDLYVIRHPFDFVNGKIKDLTDDQKTQLELYYNTHQFCENPVARNMTLSTTLIKFTTNN